MKQRFQIVLTSLILACLFCALTQLCGCAEERTPAIDPKADEASAADGTANNTETGTAYEESPGHQLEEIPPSALLSIDDLLEIWGTDGTDADHIALVDLRTRRAYNAGFIEGSLCIAAGRQLSLRLDEIPRDGQVILVDHNGSTLADSWFTLIEAGWDPDKVFVVPEGMQEWARRDLPQGFIENPSC